MIRAGYRKWYKLLISLCLISAIVLAGCGSESNSAGTSANEGAEKESPSEGENRMDDNGEFTLQTKVTDVIKDPVFEDYGRLIFPADVSISNNLELQDIEDILMWYNNVNPEKTVEIVNYMKSQAEAGEKTFYDIYTDEEKAEDPAKENTGLFFFRGDPQEKFAVVNAGGGFAYVAAMHDSFPPCFGIIEKGL